MSQSRDSDQQRRGPIAWMVRNRVTPNLLMLVLILGGLYMATRIKQEVFPEFTLDIVSVNVPYPGASPAEVEQSIVLALEEAVRGVEGIKEIRSTASEGGGALAIELLDSANRQRVYQDIQARVDRITTFPEDAEEPEVSLSARRRDVMDLEVYGDVDRRTLRNAGEFIRARLSQAEGVTAVEMDDVREFEIHVEISQQMLRRHGLTHDDVAQALRQSALEIPGGKLETSSGEIMVRVDERKDWARQFRRIPIIAGEGGSMLRLEDIAHVYEGFDDTNSEELFNGKPSVEMEVFRVGKQTPITVSDAVRGRLADLRSEVPQGIDWVIRDDASKIYRQRLELLLKNGLIGLVLVLGLLGLFLEFKLAFWVTMGIPISFLGGLLFLPWMGVSLNMISMFAFIIALGIVVDDAIIAGENIYEYRQGGMGLVEAAIRGARDIAVPITFAILTNVVAFAPMLFIPGFIGKMWAVIPLVVITVFLVSLVEALFILPAHLAHTSSRGSNRVTRYLHEKQQAFSRLLTRFVDGVFTPALRHCLNQRFLTLSIAATTLALVLSLVGSGQMGFILMPEVASSQAEASAQLPPGVSMARAREVRAQLRRAAERTVASHGGDQLSTGIAAHVWGNTVEVSVYLTDPDVRPISTKRFSEIWRQNAGPIPGTQTLNFESNRGGPGGGADLTVELSHPDVRTLERAAQSLGRRLARFNVARDIDDGYTPGKRQLDFKITERGRSLGLTAGDIAAQVRNALQGQEAIKQLRGRHEVTVRVRRPLAQRSNLYDLEQMMIRTPAAAGRDRGRVPLMNVAHVERGRAYTAIQRREGQRTLNVTADIEPVGETSRVQNALRASVLPALKSDFPGLTAGFEGRQAEVRESLSALARGMIVAMFSIYAMLAVPFRSYIQPLIVMIAIPFGIVGAVIGHLIMGYNLSVISVMGIVALSGVVVNDSLVLVEYANRQKQEHGLSSFDAAVAAANRRFRPILLTTLTTFGGLAPMIFETSIQARFMIPMAVSLGYGIVFSTAITLIIVPAMYVVLDDLQRLWAWASNKQTEEETAPALPAK